MNNFLVELQKTAVSIPLMVKYISVFSFPLSIADDWYLSKNRVVIRAYSQTRKGKWATT